MVPALIHPFRPKSRAGPVPAWPTCKDNTGLVRVRLSAESACRRAAIARYGPALEAVALSRDREVNRIDDALSHPGG